MYAVMLTPTHAIYTMNVQRRRRKGERGKGGKGEKKAETLYALSGKWLVPLKHAHNLRQDSRGIGKRSLA